MVKTHGLSHINLNVRNIQRSLAFYQQVFGLKVMFWEGEKMVFLNTPGADDVITLHEVDAAQPIGNGGVAHFGFGLDDKKDIDAAVEEVVRAGGGLLSRGDHAPGHPYAYITDPDGYVIEL
jgi:catechol 2,3-dioxygenase-like lactoylglutathione lyase family enzyme